MGDEDQEWKAWLEDFSNDYTSAVAPYNIDIDGITISGANDALVDFDQWHKQQNNNITLNGGGEEMLRVAEDGFYVRGVRVDADAKEAEQVYKAFKQWLTWNTLSGQNN